MDFALDFTPGVGSAKSIVEVVSGHNYVTGEDLSNTQRVLALAGIVPYGKVVVNTAEGIIKIAGKYYKYSNAGIVEMTVADDVPKPLSDTVADVAKGMNNKRVLQATKIRTMDVERGGSGLINIHL